MEIDTKHIFALYQENLSADSYFSTNDPVLVHRVLNVLRLSVGDTLVLFDRSVYVELVLETITKKGIQARIITRKDTPRYTPTLVLGLPLLKRSALEEAFYNACEVGVSEIFLIKTDKSHAYAYKDYERFERILIAAAEQSKNFRFPRLQPEMITLEHFLHVVPTTLFFDQAGTSITPFISQLRDETTIGLLFGPEGDLTTTEKMLVHQSKASVVSLGPTILRAEHAVLVAGGLLRALFSVN